MIAIGNSGNKDFIAYAKIGLQDEEPLVRAHAAWALSKLDIDESRDILFNHRRVETDDMVNEEIDSILGSC
jgi:epoxyqueuosine reductase